ncbi:exonuclease [Cooperia oncophora]
MVHVKVKGAAVHVDPKDVSPAWKVLQMKLKEQESEVVKMEVSPSVQKPEQKVKSRKRRLQEAFEGLQKMDEPAAKREHDVPVVIHDRSTGEATHIIALDCEYVGGGTDGRDDLLARVSIVNEEGKIVYDKYVKPRERVTDFRTSVSGIRPENIAKGFWNFTHNNRKMLTIVTPAKCHLLAERWLTGNGLSVPSLKKLANAILGIDIQQGEHDSVIDARVALRLYLAVKKKWESDIKRFRR